ncbi:Pebble, partial [Operophtera brumata]
MRGAVICFSGFRKKDELVTHLIAAAATGDKYRYASGFGLPVLARSWVDACWDRRDDPACLATEDAFTVMANGETFGRSLILSPLPSTPNSAKPSRPTPSRSQSTPKSSLYRRLSARLSGCRSSPSKQIDDASGQQARDDRENLLQLARNSLRDKHSLSREQFDDFSISCVGKSMMDDINNSKSPSHAEQVELRNCKMSNKENKEMAQILLGSVTVNGKDKREVFKNKSMNVFNLVDCLTEAGSMHSSLTKSLCELDAKDEPDFLLPDTTRNKELQQSTTTISSGKKRSRNSTDSSFQVSTIDVNISPDKSEESNWKSIKRLKIKDSFKFKNRPTIFKKTKKEAASKTAGDIVVEPVVCPESSRPTDPAGEFIASTSSPIREDDNASICSMNTSKQSGFFDISFASKTVKSASKLRRSVKSFTASFRSERKKKYEKRAERNTVEVDACHLPPELNNVSTPKRDLDEMNLDISPVQVDTVDSTNLATPVRDPDVDDLDESAVFKTPQSTRFAAAQRPAAAARRPRARRACPLPPSPSRSPRPGSRATRPPPASTPPIRDVRAISQCHGISLPVVDEHNTVVAPECSARVHVVKAEWFWASVQNEEAQDERDYLFKDYLDELSRRSSVGGAGAGAGCSAEEAGAGLYALAGWQKFARRYNTKIIIQNFCTEESEVPDNVVRKLMSPRQQVFMELLQTESNYVGILHTIVMMFKQPLEEMADTEEDNSNGKIQALLNNTELKIIFGNLPPIYELHQRMLEDLRYTQAHWSEEMCIGRLVLRYTPDMVKAYPPFVNFFENTKEMLQQCDRENPRFHAFLKICQTKPECGRQSLQELLIRPVQRLPSISLLLDDILKHTNKNNPDHSALVQALAGLREVMSHINEDKRKTEGQLQIGDHLVLFLFTDTMEVCKKRSKVLRKRNHIQMRFSHTAIRVSKLKRWFILLQAFNNCHNVFALMCRSNQELKEKLYSFMITDETVDKSYFLRQLTLSKVSKFAARTRIKVGRALSFNKTPSKLKRAMSSMISPFGSQANLTPASQLAQMRLASCNNI